MGPITLQAMAAMECDERAADESMRELVDVFESEIIEHLREPHLLFPHLDLNLIPFSKLRLHHHHYQYHLKRLVRTTVEQWSFRKTGIMGTLAKH